MDVRAIVLLCPPEGRLNSFGVCAETIGGVPIAALDVLGAPVYERVIERLRNHGISDITVVCDLPADAARFLPRASSHKRIESRSGQVWRAMEAAFSGYAQNGADAVLAIRIGAYAEIDYDGLLQFHHDARSRITAASDKDGNALDTFVLSASRRNDAAFLFRHQMQSMRVPSPAYVCHGYVNRLSDAIDLRRLAVDTFLQRTAVRPAGREIRSGVWVADGARVQKGARLLAPSFVGRRAKVRPAAVVTRFSCLEHHSEVDCGTVVENTTVLPYTYIGAGLDASHAVLGMKRLVHLRRQIEVEVGDPKLVSSRASSAAVRTLSSALSLTGFLPMQLVRGFFSPAAQGEPTPGLPESLNPSAAELQPQMADADRQFALARRYGDQ